MVGSANLTGGLVANVEVATGLEGAREDPMLEQLWAWAERTWLDPRAFPWIRGPGVVAEEPIERELLELMQRAMQNDPVVYTLGPRPKPNRVSDVAASGLQVETKRSSERTGGSAHVPAWMLNLAWETLRARGTLSNSELLNELRVHRSSFVCAMLARLPGVETVPGREIVLRWVGSAAP